MTKKRGNGEGMIRKRPNGLWEYRYSAGYDDNGNPITRSVYARKQKEALAKGQEIEKAIASGTYVAPSAITVSEWLDVWFETYFRPTHRDTTATVFIDYINSSIRPALGGFKVQKLRQENLQAFFNHLFEDGKAPTTIRKVHVIIRSALEQAVDNNIVSTNVADRVKLPKIETKDIEVLTLEEQRVFVAALPNTDNGRALRFILSTGLRVSELCGLRWQDIGSDSFRITQGVVRTKNFEKDKDMAKGKTKLTFAPPKSKAGNREIPLTKTTRDILAKQRSEVLSNRLKAGDVWIDHDLVFCSPVGTPKDSANIRRTLRSALDRANVRQIGVHALRHTFATNALRAGVDPRTLSILIGHSKLAFTLQTYVHPDAGTLKASMQAIDSLL